MISNFLILMEDTHIGDNICGETNVLKAVRFVGYFLALARLFVPIIIIGFGIFDIYKTVIAGTTDSFIKQLKSLGLRFVIGVLIFFIPTLISSVLTELEGFNVISSEYKSCEKCLLKPFNCNP